MRFNKHVLCAGSVPGPALKGEPSQGEWQRGWWAAFTVAYVIETSLVSACPYLPSAKPSVRKILAGNMNSGGQNWVPVLPLPLEAFTSHLENGGVIILPFQGCCWDILFE